MPEALVRERISVCWHMSPLLQYQIQKWAGATVQKCACSWKMKNGQNCSCLNMCYKKRWTAHELSELFTKTSRALGYYMPFPLITSEFDRRVGDFKGVSTRCLTPIGLHFCLWYNVGGSDIQTQLLPLHMQLPMGKITVALFKVNI